MHSFTHIACTCVPLNFLFTNLGSPLPLNTPSNEFLNNQPLKFTSCIAPYISFIVVFTALFFPRAIALLVLISSILCFYLSHKSLPERQNHFSFSFEPDCIAIALQLWHAPLELMQVQNPHVQSTQGAHLGFQGWIAIWFGSETI